MTAHWKDHLLPLPTGNEPYGDEYRIRFAGSWSFTGPKATCQQEAENLEDWAARIAGPVAVADFRRTEYETRYAPVLGRKRPLTAGERALIPGWAHEMHAVAVAGEVAS